MSNEDLCDGFISVIRGKQTVQMGTLLDPSKVSVGQVRKFYQLGEFIEENGLQIGCDMDAVSMSTEVDIDHTTNYVKSLVRHFKKNLKEVGIVKKPLLCTVRVPTLPHHRL